MSFCLFSTCRPFIGTMAMVQRNAILSWRQLNVPILLLGKDEGTEALAREMCLHYRGEVEHTPEGTPLVRGLFRQAQQIKLADTLCYINADIIIVDGFCEAVQLCQEKFPTFLMVAQRYNAEILEPIPFNNDWRRWVKERIGSLMVECAVDFFCWRGDFWGDIPPYAVGRYVWDNWLMWRALTAGVPVVDMTGLITIVHQSHQQLPWEHKEAKANNAAFRGGMAGIKDCSYRYRDGQIQRV